jgi:hypothetical protein
MSLVPIDKNEEENMNLTMWEYVRFAL